MGQVWGESMKRKILALALIGLSCVSLFANPVNANEDPNGPEVPFPLSIELPFPWGTIEGIWMARGKGLDAYFSFEVQTGHFDWKMLRVIQIDPVGKCSVAEGVGVAVTNSNVVRAAMAGDGGSYMLYIGSYKNDHSIFGPHSVTVLTIRSFHKLFPDDTQLIVKKVGNYPYQAHKCVKKSVPVKR